MLEIDLSQFERVVEDLKHDVNLIQDFTNDQYFRSQITEIINKNFQDIWNTQGSSIGENWKGRTLVKTGNLRNSLTTPRISVRVTNNVVYFNSPVPYASFVNEMYRFYGVSAETTEEIAELWGDVLRTQGRLNWTTT